MGFNILVINPGSTSTKIAIYEGENKIFSENIFHSEAELVEYNNIIEQREFRKDIILKFLADKNISLCSLDAVVGRGGLLNPIPGGTYYVNEKMFKDLEIGVQGEHASNLGGILAAEIASQVNIPAFIVDPVVVDEFEEVARLTGIPEIRRRSIFHALNHKGSARLAAKKMEKEYDEVNLVIAHLGGGISVSAYKKGKVIDVNNALNGEGPIAPERAGTLPAWDLIELALSGKYSKCELKKKITGKGGMVALLGTNDMKKVMELIRKGDKQAKLVFDAMAYRIAKEIGAYAAALSGQVDAVVITGGLAHCEEFVEKIKNYVSFIGKIFIFPGEDEMKALALGALRVLKGEEKAKEYI